MCRQLPSTFLYAKKGAVWTYESEVSSPSIRRISSMCVHTMCLCGPPFLAFIPHHRLSLTCAGCLRVRKKGVRLYDDRTTLT